MHNNQSLKFDQKQILGFYRDMLLIRRFEERAGQLYGMGLIGGFCHLYIGQEAVAVGMKALMQKSDRVITTYRDHGHMIMTGSDPKNIMAELLGRKDGSSKGKGGSMHLFDIEKNFFGGHGIVGASVPIGTGLAFADKYLGNKAVTFCYYGDGAAHQGQVYESYNMAKLWNLPVIFIIENNKYAMGTAVHRSSANLKLHKRGLGFDIPGYEVDGMDIFKVINDSKQIVEDVRNGNGPAIIEMDTYRYRGHSMSDPATYRSKDEVNDKKQKDPIINIKNHMIKDYKILENEIKKIDDEVKIQINEIVEFAKNSPEPDESELMTDIYQ
jgi:pyruvate dehydrogenase E1 component alpha subunit